MDNYINFVKQYPFISASIQFAILGTLGECIALWVKRKSLSIGWSFWTFIGKVLAWALLGIVVKLGFIGMKAFTLSIIAQGFMPEILKCGIGKAFLISLFTNIFFGPQMMLFHRIEDNIIEGKWNFNNIQKAWMTLIWFWIPAHTLTFSLPTHYQIGLAAIWGLVLGIILGTTKK
ncbi:MAG: hypothetical protein M0R46_03000 [Candidatus Muirbacterium halophilum]|nr:hypothetical protein [Candidatus Muirbacterium halophilum]MCK9474859.1 hypothetical protein [Candidatus Muirbacterium halophilum]